MRSSQPTGRLPGKDGGRGVERRKRRLAKKLVCFFAVEEELVAALEAFPKNGAFRVPRS